MGSESGLVSVITPAYNAAAFIGEAIASVKAQTYLSWEMIIADDGSSDETAAVVQEESGRDPRIRFLAARAHTGLPACVRNRAMAQARGEYLAFLDADDRWAPDKLDRQVAYLHAHPEADGVCCWFDTFGDPARVKHERFRMPTAPVCSRAEIVTGIPFFTVTILFRRLCYEEIGGMDEDPRLRMGEDAEYFARLVTRFQIHRICSVLAHYRLASIERPSQSIEHIGAQNEAGLRLLDVFQEKGTLTPRELRRRRAHTHYELARLNLHLFHRPFRRHLWRAVATGAPSWQAVITFVLCFLPTGVLSKLLMSLQGGWNRFIALRHAEK